jgi:ATP-dependent protease ClpP protease subunit
MFKIFVGTFSVTFFCLLTSMLTALPPAILVYYFLGFPTLGISIGALTHMLVFFMLTRTVPVLSNYLMNSTTKLFLLRNRTVVLNGSINSRLSSEIFSQIKFLNLKNTDPIYLFINSRGGNLYGLRCIVGAIHSSKAPVIGIVVGVAFSAAVLVLQCCNKRFALPESLMLIHNPRLAYLKLNYHDVDLKGIRSMKRYLNRALRNLSRDTEFYERLLRERSGLEPDAISAICNLELTAGQAAEYKLIDGIIADLPPSS